MKKDEIVSLAKGLATRIPFLYSLLRQRQMNPGDATAAYSYAVWLKHLSLLHDLTGAGVPHVVAELGPGDTLGTGVAALLSGAERYFGVDVLPFAQGGQTMKVANDLVDLFRSRAPVEVSGWPDFRPLLDDRSFPSGVLSQESLAASLAPERTNAILVAAARAIALEDDRNACMRYAAPFDASSIPPESVDLFVSQSVLEHVEDLPQAFALMRGWLKPGGMMSHQFDLRSHNITRTWDGHRAFGKRSWKIVVGNRPFLLNRLPFCDIVETVERAGFRIVDSRRNIVEPTLARAELCAAWRDLADVELGTIGGYVLAQRL
ncbi:MAG TPA: class I SAM-dependent methyltransferase [Rhizomicrobium sp.]